MKSPNLLVILLTTVFFTPLYADTMKIHYCAITGDVACMKQAINEGSSVNERSDNYNLTPIDITLMKGFYGATDFLLKRGARAKKRGGQTTPETVAFAAAAGHMSAFKKFYKVKPNKLYMYAAGFMEIHVIKSRRTGKPIFATKVHIDRYHRGVIANVQYPQYTLLHIAAMNGHLEIMKYLVADGAKIDVPMNLGRYSEQAIHAAARGGNAEAVSYLMTLGAKLDTRDSDDATPLHHAAQYSTAEMVDALLGMGAKPELENKKAQTAAALAMVVKKFDTIEVFKKRGHKFSAFELVQTGDHKNLFSSYPSLNMAARDSRGETLLHAAVRFQQRDTAKHLVEKGADINARNQEGQTALFIAARFGYVDEIELLLSKGADPNIGDRQNSTVIMTYLRPMRGKKKEKIDLAVAKKMIAKGADVNLTDKHGWGPLHFVTASAESVKFLIYNGANVNQANSSGETPIYLAVRFAELESITALIENGANLNVQGRFGQTLLGHSIEMYNRGRAIKESRLIIVKLLLSKGVDVNYKSDEGLGGFFEALPSDRSPIDHELITLLVRYGANINQFDNRGFTPLHRMIDREDRASVRLMVRLGADPVLKSKNGFAAREFAKKMWKSNRRRGAKKIYRYFRSDDFKEDQKETAKNMPG